jgi:hypothetical protein
VLKKGQEKLDAAMDVRNILFQLNNEDPEEDFLENIDLKDDEGSEAGGGEFDEANFTVSAEGNEYDEEIKGGRGKGKRKPRQMNKTKNPGTPSFTATPLSPKSRASKKLVDQESHEDSHDIRGTADYLKKHHDENLRVGSIKKNVKELSSNK